MFLRKTLAPAAAGIILLAGALALAPAAPAAAQEVVQDEGATYRAWHEASQAADNVKAMAAAKAYIEKYPTGQYADFMKKWLGTAQLTALDAAIKEKRMADMIAVGRDILATDPDNLNVLYALAFNIRRNELVAAPPSFANAPAAVEFSKKAMSLVESGKTLTGVASFDKNATLAWLTQILAVNEGKNGSADQAIELYEKSITLAPQDASVAARSLLAVFMLHQTRYSDAVKAYKAFPEADLAATDPKPEVKAARDAFNAAADGLIGAAARFVAYSKVKSLPASPARDRINQTLEAVYKSRFPEDASLAGLQKMLQEKEAAFGAAPGA